MSKYIPKSLGYKTSNPIRAVKTVRVYNRKKPSTTYGKEIMYGVGKLLIIEKLGLANPIKIINKAGELYHFAVQSKCYSDIRKGLMRYHYDLGRTTLTGMIFGITLEHLIKK